MGHSDLEWALPPVRLGRSGRNSENFRKDPGNALRASPGIPLESTAGIPQALQFKAFEASRAFPEFSPPQYDWGRLFFQKWSGEGPSELAMEFPAVLRAFLIEVLSEAKFRTEFAF